MATVPSGNLPLLQHGVPHVAAGRHLLHHSLPRGCRGIPAPAPAAPSPLTLGCSSCFLPLTPQALVQRSALSERHSAREAPPVADGPTCALRWGHRNRLEPAGTGRNSPAASTRAPHLAPRLTQDTGNGELCPATAVSYHISARPGTRTFCTALFTREELCSFIRIRLRTSRHDQK